MPEYLAPGVFVEETSYRARSIEGVSTTTTGFIGPTRFGPTDTDPELITSLVEYERVYGDRQPLSFEAPPKIHNYMWHAVRAFFENGGKRLYVQRVFEAAAPDPGGLPAAAPPGHAHANLGAGGPVVFSRFPGAAGTRRVRISLSLGPNIVAPAPGVGASPPQPPTVRGLKDRDVVWIDRFDSPPTVPTGSPPAFPARSGEFFLARSAETATGLAWSFTPADGGPAIRQEDLHADNGNLRMRDELRVVTASVTVFPADPDGLPLIWSGLALDPAHETGGFRDSLFDKFEPAPEDPEARRTIPIVITPGSATDGLGVLAALVIPGSPAVALRVGLATELPDDDRSLDLKLDGGDDGVRPTAGAYEGDSSDISDKSGLKAFEDLEDISIVAAPGATHLYEEDSWRPNAATINALLVAHAERMRYRIAVLDAGENQSLSQVREMKGGLDSKHAALYYPWVRIMDPVTQQEISVPPSGFVAGIYARNDIERAVYKAPANEVVRLAIGFERTLNTAQQEVLNPEGINCLRFFEGRGYRLWGARTISSDPEWKYVNLRRYFAYLERSIDVGTQWAVFEPNGPRLWANVRRTIADFLFNEFVLGAYLGDKPETSYFVKCDRSTMTQNDIDNGRLVCLVGVAVVKPAEFVIFRVGQWTADAKL
jgi:phage tail sheath protein FI